MSVNKCFKAPSSDIGPTQVRHKSDTSPTTVGHGSEEGGSYMGVRRGEASLSLKIIFILWTRKNLVR